MTDKVQKIREGIEKLKSNLIHGACSSQVAMETRCKEEAYNDVLAILDTMQEEPVSKQKLSNVQRYVKNWKEPVSEDLEEASKEWLRPQLDKSYADYGEVKMMELTHFDGYAMLDAIEFGANWQKEKEYTCYEEAFEDGARWKKEQMMAKAIDGDITFDYYGDDDKTYGCIAHDSFCLEDKGLKDRDKVKLIIIKEE